MTPLRQGFGGHGPDPKLKPCPFCGAAAKAGVGCLSVWCYCTSPTCGVEGPRIYSSDRSSYPSEAVELAAELWNERCGLDAEAQAIRAENDRLLRLRHSDSWLESALLQLLHENGIEPGSRLLIEAMERAGINSK